MGPTTAQHGMYGAGRAGLPVETQGASLPAPAGQGMAPARGKKERSEGGAHKWPPPLLRCAIAYFFASPSALQHSALHSLLLLLHFFHCHRCLLLLLLLLLLLPSPSSSLASPPSAAINRTSSASELTKFEGFLNPFEQLPFVRV